MTLILGGGVMWVAGLISEAVHNHNISQALKQAARKSKEDPSYTIENILPSIVENKEEQNKEEQKNSKDDPQYTIENY